MGKTSATSVSIADGATAVAANHGGKDGTHDFLLLCKNGRLAEAVHALYYLPANYKLMVVSDSALAMDWAESALKGRISYETAEKVRQNPSYAADAIISDDTEAAVIESTGRAPYVVVSATAGEGIMLNGLHGLAVRTGNPEALASAILHISRKR